MSKLALFGGEKAINKTAPAEMFRWPVITQEDEEAVLEVLRRGAMSGTDVTEKFEEEFAAWNGTKYAIGYSSGTMSLQAAMYSIGLGQGDELICQSKTYWASCIQAMALNATVVFADINEDTLTIDPNDLERCIGPRTKAIMVVHYLAHPADMDGIMAVAKKHNLKVIEDVSHAQGGYYKGKKLGTFGDVAAMSLMSGKSFATGEMGMLVTNNKEVYDRAMAYSHYERNNAKYVQTDYLAPYYSMPLGAMKGRVNQTCAAMGRVQLKYYDQRCHEIQKAMNYFWDLLEGCPGIKAHRPKDAGSDKAGWYAPYGLWKPDEVEGLPVERFAEALKAEGFGCGVGGNRALHTHEYFKTFDLYNAGVPTRIQFAERDVRELDKDLPVTESIEIYSTPWFKKFNPEIIEMYAAAYRKVAENYKELLKDAPPRKKGANGRWFFYGSDED